MGAATYGFAYSEKALAYLRTLPAKLRRQIIKKVEALASDPYPPTAKLLQETKDDPEPVHRIRSGDYRVLYVVRETTIAVLDIDHRKDVYR